MRHQTHCHLLRTALLLISCLTTALASVDERASELAEAQGLFDDGVIKFTDDLFKQYLMGTRDYHLAVFLTANQMKDNTELALEHVRKEFGLASKAFMKGGEAPDLFFVEMAFEDAQGAFQALGVNTLPFMYYIPADMKISAAKLSIPKTNRMDIQSVRAKYPWTAETFVEWISAKSGFAAGPVERAQLTKHPLFPLLVVLSVAGLGMTAWKLYFAKFMHQPFVWTVGSLVVFWFSTSGAMYNIIRGMPMMTKTKEGKPIYFINQRGSQLGAEGFIMGGSYILFSLFISFLTYGVPLCKDRLARQVLGFMAVAGAGYTVYQIFTVYMWKSGYKFVPYF